jgi:superkiller protein 3
MANTTYTVQAAIQDSLPVLQEIVSLLEEDEEEAVKKEVANRRTRLNAAGPEQLKKDVGVQVWGASQVGIIHLIGLD